ncbi:MAG: hypothetical protein JSR58_02615 [Verrucomicrobia bacterium]|nr:hypothetical protein [Verrucomicrobiota bacterium]
MRYVLLFLLLVGCEKHYISVRQMQIGPDYLASAHIGSPDPRRADPPIGEKLVIDWSVPPDILTQNPKIVLHLIFRNHTEKFEFIPIHHKMGFEVYSLLRKEFHEKQGLLTYRAEIVTQDGHIYRDWKHQLWVNLITLDHTSPEEQPAQD